MFVLQDDGEWRYYACYVYVDDILCATNSESKKRNLFTNLDDQYGIKDQGVVYEYLGVQVKMKDDYIHEPGEVCKRDSKEIWVLERSRHRESNGDKFAPATSK